MEDIPMKKILSLITVLCLVLGMFAGVANAAELTKMGVAAEELPDGLVIHGTGVVKGSTELDRHGDHRIVMSLAVAALAAEGSSVIKDAECAGVTYPGFFETFKALGADFTVS